MVVQFLATDYEKALPNFVKILDVPFVALSEVANRNYRLNDTSCIKFLRSYTKFADDAWFKYCGLPTERSIQTAKSIPGLQKVASEQYFAQ